MEEFRVKSEKLQRIMYCTLITYGLVASLNIGLTVLICLIQLKDIETTNNTFFLVSFR